MTPLPPLTHPLPFPQYKANGKAKKPRLHPTMPRHVIVAVCCYKEPAPIVSLTLVHAAQALLELGRQVPEMTAELVLCDDEVAAGSPPSSAKAGLTKQLSAKMETEVGAWEDMESQLDLRCLLTGWV